VRDLGLDLQARQPDPVDLDLEAGQAEGIGSLLGQR